MQNLVKETIKQEENNLKAFSYLIKREQESVIGELERFGADFLETDGSGNNISTEIVKLGNVSLLNKIGSYAQAINGKRAQATEKINANRVGKLQNLLHTACGHTLPNLDIIESLVERFGISVNVNKVHTVKHYDQLK